MGLANGVASPGNSLQAAVELAHKIAKFPAKYHKASRLSTYRQWSQDTAEALINEAAAAYSVYLAEALPGARCFTSGLGRHADFKDI